MGKIETHEFASMTPDAKRELLMGIAEVSCLVIRKRALAGIDKEWIVKKFELILKSETDSYGEEHGMRRRVKEVLTYTEDGALIAFAVICYPGPMFHRLRAVFVEQSIFLALLCGAKAGHIMDEIIARYGHLWITLDALPHVIGFYLRPRLGAAMMIDTPKSFELSTTFRTKYNKTANKRTRDTNTEWIVGEMRPEIRKADEFVMRQDSGSRRNGPIDWTYGQAHIALPPTGTALTFTQMCHASVDGVDALPDEMQQLLLLEPPADRDDAGNVLVAAEPRPTRELPAPKRVGSPRIMAPEPKSRRAVS